MSGNIEQWIECSDWLIRCEVPIINPPCSIEGLAKELRDGVLLCRLLNTLDPDSVDIKHFCEEPQMTKVQCIQNLELFLQNCKNVFGLEQMDLFEPEALFDFYDIYQVIHTLSKLSMCPRARRRVASGFYFCKTQSPSSLDNYKKINTRCNEEEYEEFRQSMKHITHFSNVGNEETDKEVCGSKQSQKSEISSLTHLPQIRNEIVEEIIATEREYVTTLKGIQKAFIEPLKKKMSPEDIEGIFGEIEELHNLHQTFYKVLEETKSPNSKLSLSKVFISTYQKFLIYGDYCTNILNARVLLQQKCKEDPSLGTELTRCQTTMNSRFSLEDLLITPVHRITKYHLLLDRLCGETQPNDKDYCGLLDAKDDMKDIVAYINEQKRDKEMLDALQKIQESIVGLKMPANTTLKDYGRCLKKDELQVRGPLNRDFNKRYVFLFDCVMLICKTLKENKYSYEDSLDISKFLVEDTHPDRTRGSYFQWHLVSKNENKVYTFLTRQEEQRKEWISIVEKTLDNIRPRCLLDSDHQIRMKTFKERTICNYCTKALKGLIFQGYFCKRCQMSLHKDCISSSKCDRYMVWHSSLSRVPRELPPPPDRGLKEWYDRSYLGQYTWFVGEQEREKATEMLKSRCPGTFLVRIRPGRKAHPYESVYALGLRSRTALGVHHIIVYEKRINGPNQYHLIRDSRHYFKSIVDLIEFYSCTNLPKKFGLLDAKLMVPYMQEATKENIYTSEASNVYECVDEDVVLLPTTNGRKEDASTVDHSEQLGFKKDSINCSSPAPIASNVKCPYGQVASYQSENDDENTSSETSKINLSSNVCPIETFGKFIATELKTIKDETIFLEVKRAIQIAIMDGRERYNPK